jgi:hypothetical protein
LKPDNNIAKSIKVLGPNCNGHIMKAMTVATLEDHTTEVFKMPKKKKRSEFILGQ